MQTPPELFHHYYRMALPACTLDESLFASNFRGYVHVRQISRSSSDVLEHAVPVVTTFEFTDYVDAVVFKLEMSDVEIHPEGYDLENIWSTPFRSHGFSSSKDPLAFDTDRFAPGVKLPNRLGFFEDDPNARFTPKITDDTTLMVLKVPEDKVEIVDKTASDMGVTKHYDSDTLLTWLGEFNWMTFTMKQDNRDSFRATFEAFVENEASLK